MTTPLEAALKDAIAAHGTWKLKLRTSVNSGKAAQSADEIACHTCCAFGIWMHDPRIVDEHGASIPYRVIDRLHAEFHAVAADITDLVIAGDVNRAKTMLETTFNEHSTHLVRGMTKWIKEARMNAAEAA